MKSDRYTVFTITEHGYVRWITSDGRIGAEPLQGQACNYDGACRKTCSFEHKRTSGAAVECVVKPMVEFYGGAYEIIREGE